MGAGYGLITDLGCAKPLLETGLGRRAHGIKPAAYVYLGMGFAAVMPGSGRCGSVRIPPLDGKLRV
ncbi:MAG: hypothetical protein WBW38_13635, partial [Candidatus Sulfotelmatobacter sp.]